MDEEEHWLQEDDCKSRPFRAVRVREVIELFNTRRWSHYSRRLRGHDRLLKRALLTLMGSTSARSFRPSLCWNVILRECSMRRA
jgi:hypothetical protein